MQKGPVRRMHAFVLALALTGIWFLAAETSSAAGQKDADKPARTSPAATARPAAAAAAKAEAPGSPVIGNDKNAFSDEPVENVLKPPKQEKTGRQEQSTASAADKGKKDESGKKHHVKAGDAWLKKGLEYGAQKEYDKAIDAYTMAIKHDAADASGYYNRGVIFQKCARYELAIRDYTRASQITPDDADIYYNRGLSYHSAGQPDLAIKDYTRAIALSRSDSSPFWNRAVAFSRAGRQDLALADYCMAIDLSKLEAKTKVKPPQ